MHRKLKMLGAVMAAIAMLAMTTSVAQAQFTSAAYPATVTGTSSKDVIDFFGTGLTCSNSSFSGSLTAASTTLQITPSYKTCHGAGLPATVDTTGCTFLFHKNPGASGSVDVACPAGKAIDLTVYSGASHTTALCHLQIPAQTGKSGYALANSGGNIVISGSVGGITATQNRTSIFCPSGTHTPSATYTVQTGGITLTGNNGGISVD